ncbi:MULTISPECIES: hypothetical protein [Nocardiopsis]|uniref:Trp biosynthesis protein n=1 Tax=Nocardiopsis changdeensis TaxID=2831969 RepID=A0ABX8BTZ6_9ACTN|nr:MULTISPECIES: hypothetical protein [Nocardiopsis]QUX25482.1 hypothetical protein KGD84_15290 [Nocardiopsis changdeensis]QYX35868.1 hypothetical protein K1J57_24745 [Nocardiopsis sp. MT53]
MRHIVGFLSGLILAPVLLLACGWAFSHLRSLHAAERGVLEGSGPLVLAGLVGVGVIVALLAVPPRLTPMLPLSVALVLGSATGVALVRGHLLERLPPVPGLEGALDLLPLGVFVPVALVLAATVFVGGRWRRSEEHEVTEEEYFEGLYEEGEERPADKRAEPEAQHVPRHRA